MSEIRDISAVEAWRILESDPESALVDVRTAAEWTFVGVPELSSIGKRTVLIEWHGFPNRGVNPNFAGELAAAGLDADRTLIFICRSGGRSRSAARLAQDSGYRTCFNLAGGFEGDRDSAMHRGRTGGWKLAGLPWIQG